MNSKNEKISDASITENVAAPEEVENNLWWKTCCDGMNRGILMITKDESVKYLNPAAEKILGHTLKSCVGKNYLEIYKVYKNHSDESFICAIQDPFYNPEELLNNNWLIDGNNRHLQIEESVTEVKDNEDKVIGKIISFMDVTTKRSNQLAVVTSRNFYLSLMEDFPVPVWRANAEGYFNYFNQAWLDITGRVLEEEIHFGWMERIHEEDKAAFENLFRKSFEKKERFECEFRILNREGKYSWILSVGTPFNDVHKKFSGYIFAGVDLTKRKTLEEEIRKAMKKAEAASEAKSTFIANMSHEVRTPLNGIVGLTEILLDTELTLDQSECLLMLKQASKVLLDLLNNVLDQSKMEVGKITLQETDFFLDEIIDEIWTPFAAQATAKQLAAIKKSEWNGSNKIFGDKMKIQQIVLNLLTNALKFTERGSIELHLFNEDKFKTTSPINAIPNLHILVKDTGIGIPLDQHERIFESFTQVDSSSTKRYAGAGLGLSIVKNLVELFHGKLWVNSQPGVGSEFHALLKLKLTQDTISTQQSNSTKLN